MTGHHELRYPVPWLHSEGLIGQIHKKGPELAAIIGVNGTRGIKDGNAVLNRKAAARADLTLIALRQGHVKASGEKPALKWLKGHRLGDISPYIHAGRKLGSVSRRREGGFIDDFNFHCINYLGAILYSTPAITAKTIFGSHIARAVGIAPV